MEFLETFDLKINHKLSAEILKRTVSYSSPTLHRKYLGNERIEKNAQNLLKTTYTAILSIGNLLGIYG